MGMSYPPPLMIAGARCVLDCLWMDGKGHLPKNLDRIYAAARAYSDQERANLAEKVKAIRNQLLSVANRTDGAGTFLFGGQGATTHVETDRDPVAVLGDDTGAPLRLLERCGADVDPPAAGGQGRLERLVVADAAAHLGVDVEGAHDLGLQLAVGAAAEGGVEVDEVQPLGALLLPRQRGLERVAEVTAGAGHP